MLSRRNKYLLFISICLVFLFSTFHYREEIPELSQAITDKIHDNIPSAAKPPPAPPAQVDDATAASSSIPPPPHENEASSTQALEATTPPPPPPAPTKHKFKYKPQPTILPDPIIDNFPLAAAAKSAKDLPPIPSWNRPPAKHVRENTPLFIGFTRNWRLLQQVVVSYITAGWPPEDIYVVENTGVMDSNAKSLLSLQNPFFLNHTRLHLLGVNILVTPTLLSFAQLQNYFIFHSIERGWKQFFWGHMDIVALSFEDKYISEKEEESSEAEAVTGAKKDYSDFKSLYAHCVDELREATRKNETTGEERNWALRFFFYDKLALVNVPAFVGIGAWDTQIPFYGTDCDMHARLNMAGLEIKEVPAGWLIDVGSSLDDLYTLYRKVDSPPASFIDPQILEKKIQAAAEAEAAAAKSTPAVENETTSRSPDPSPVPEPEAKVESEPEPAKAAKRDNSKEAWFEYLTGSDPASSQSKNWRSPDDTLNSTSFALLYNTLKAMEHSKATSSHGRNMWQARQRGGEGDPFYRDSVGFERGIGMAIDHGRAVFAEKWGHWDCDIWELGLRPEDAWRVEKDW
ncbi:hypothetical protein BKA65DRAFT_503445 [Rhexocercosporidium sp. MPI-PUGE-AT-0058]|nr:hypothetical protein BKA65DRAFT_503445 [Rhexocercosporidium sp. MPI-PUGE-AT-0058]